MYTIMQFDISNYTVYCQIAIIIFYVSNQCQTYLIIQNMQIRQIILYTFSLESEVNIQIRQIILPA